MAKVKTTKKKTTTTKKKKNTRAKVAAKVEAETKTTIMQKIPKLVKVIVSIAAALIVLAVIF